MYIAAVYTCVGKFWFVSCTRATCFKFRLSHCQDDPEDLYFRKGDVMTVLRKDEDEWWFARHSDGREGSIPVPYVMVVSKRGLYTCSLCNGGK